MQTSIRAKQCQTVPNSAQNASVFYTPRFSYSVSETVICTCPSGPVTVRRHRAGRHPCWSTGPSTGIRVGIREGYTGVLPTQLPRAEGAGMYSEAGPGIPSPAGGGVEWVVHAWDRPLRVSRCVRLVPYPPCGPGRAWEALPGRGPGSSGKRARLRTLFSKVSQNDEVSPKVSKRPVIVPILKNGSRKSPLDFLRFPSEPAFSHKELMGRFDPRG